MEKYPPRPRATWEIILKAAEKIANELGWTASGATEIARAYINSGPDGFAIAKELDSNGWYIAAGDVTTLDEMYWPISCAVRCQPSTEISMTPSRAWKPDLKKPSRDIGGLRAATTNGWMKSKNETRKVASYESSFFLTNRYVGHPTRVF